MRSWRAYGYRVADRVRRLYWLVRRPQTFGVKCVVCHDGRWLMIRNTYGRRHWTFPGGGIERGETAEHAVRREVREEVGIELPDVHLVGTYVSIQRSRDSVTCFSARVDTSDVTIDAGEIAEARWFRPDDLPDRLSPAVGQVQELLSDT